MTRKEIITEYKNRQLHAGVFQLRNTANGKIFVEGSTNLDKIWNRHRLELELGSHRNTELQRDWKTYGEAAFVFEILGELDVRDQSEADLRKEVKLLESMYLEELQPFAERGYHSVPNRR